MGSNCVSTLAVTREDSILGSLGALTSSPSSGAITTTLPSAKFHAGLAFLRISFAGGAFSSVDESFWPLGLSPKTRIMSPTPTKQLTIAMPTPLPTNLWTLVDEAVFIGSSPALLQSKFCTLLGGILRRYGVDSRL